MSSANQSGTFVYTPDIACSIYTDSGIVNVSADIINFTVTRQINAVSQLNMTLANPGRKYNRKINTMDRIVVFLKRTSWVQVFTGYITFAPIETLVPTPINIAADCTLRILQNTYWDDTLQAFQQLLLNNSDTAAASSDHTLNDGGVAQALVNVLTQVCNWDPSRIHIQAIPINFLEYASANYIAQTTGATSYLNQNLIASIASMIGAHAYVAGGSYVSGGLNTTNNHTVVVSGQPSGTYFTVKKAQAFYSSPLPSAPAGTDTVYSWGSEQQVTTHPMGRPNTPGYHPDNPVNGPDLSKDIYWCGIPFAYSNFTTTSGKQDSKKWAAKNSAKHKNDGRLLFLQNGDKAVVVRATSLIQKPNAIQNGMAVVETDVANIDYLQVHPAVVAYLNGDPTASDPTKFKLNNQPASAPIWVDWADETKVSVGPQAGFSQAVQNAYSGSLGVMNGTAPTTNAVNVLLQYAAQQVGAVYSQAQSGPEYRETPRTGTNQGAFDCSGFTQWCYKKINIHIGGDTWAQWGAGNSSDNATHGLFLGTETVPQPGDLLFWEIPEDNKLFGGLNKYPPQHVSMVYSAFDPKTGAGQVIQAGGDRLAISPLNWNDIKGGQWLQKGTTWQARYIGARSPMSLYNGWTVNFSQTGTTVSKSNNVNPNSAEAQLLNLQGSFNTLMNPPSFDVRAGAIVGTPRAFLLDNNVMADIQQIIGAGLRNYMSAPNGDFVAWFADYYGIFGTDPAIEISPVEIIDFQIYHDDNQLVTHYGVVGDTNGVGMQTSFGDYISTNGIVSVEDGVTMQTMFGSLGAIGSNTKNALNFLNKYGMRPMVSEQNMLRSHSMEYMYAIYGFMQQWANQYASTITLTFMPELYPGMRVTMNIDNELGKTDQYQFYCTAVTHQGSRSSGFTTQAVFTAPKKNGEILDYGYGYATWQ